MSLLGSWLHDMLARIFDKVDLPLLLALLAVMLVSLLVQASAGDGNTHMVLAQGARFAAGLVAMVMTRFLVAEV